MFGWIARLRKRSTDPSTPGDAIVLGERDCHSHVIPGVDDGSRSLEESLAMLRLLVADGVRIIVATPHIYPAKYPNEPEGLRAAFDGLRRARDAAGIEVELELGAEHYLDDSLLTRIENNRFLSFGPERYVLFETSTGAHTPAPLMDVVYALVERGYTPLIAHVERYQYLRGDEGRELCEDLRAAGAKFQVNRTVGKANVPGQGGRGGLLRWLIERDFVDEVGSDLHRATADGRPDAHRAEHERAA